MPIFLRRAADIQVDHHQSLLRIIKDIPAQNRLHELVAQWHAMPAQFDLWLAIFNDRPVGFALLQASEIKALAVHGATRGRGVGHRMVSLLKQECPSLKVSAEISNQWLIELVGALK